MTQTELPFDVKQAEAKRDSGINRAELHAEQEKPGWRGDCLKCLEGFLIGRGDRPFLAEVFRMYARNAGVVDPPDARAWGGVMKAAHKKGLITTAGVERALTSNRSYKVLWQRKG